MQTKIYDPSAPKKALNLSINSDLLRQAKETGLNLSQVLESQLTDLLQEARREEWRKENRKAIDAYNRRIELSGAFSEGRRRF
ncbi:MAG: type II toxin-antitoxin system CcdA family antitoxin [Proteobacteria bacterium]|nr:type II toxin-antitoxin system CcdA family antitoxin [Pseudomonadota bacterium]MBU1736636.1 type II toxin-antitoxin system CcdA family antitoxin [Pseudomonadota bacterium]